MVPRRFSWLVAVAVLFVAASSAAQSASTAASPGHRVLALVVTSNKSSRLARPDLRYADDDGAKYRELFRMFAPDDAVSLLTSFDHDSERLFPDLAGKVKRPQRGHVFAEAARLGQMAAEATARGENVDFYFVFAGHGDVDQGRGFLELEDGALYADDLERLLKSVPSTHSHVLIDSCNSFFVLAARKPGGRRFATATDAAQSLNQRLPNVGVFLSTSAEAETFEWSEVGGGVFSHIVRSGLSGAADANGDGEVSYDELAAFAHTASADVKNPRFRPQVFARGPSGVGQTTILRTRDATGTRLRLPKASGRITVRDQDEIPWLDAHAEPEVDPIVVAPSRFASGVVDAYEANGVARRTVREMSAGAGELALAGSPITTDARGAGDVFRVLFATPFGPRAFARYQVESAQAPPAVYGVADDDTRRMNELLDHAAENARSQRHLQALGFSSGALVFGAFAASGAFHGEAFSTGLWGGIGGVFAASGIYRLALPSREERALDWFSARRRAGSSAQLTYEAETRLFEMAEADRRERVFWRWVGIATGATAVSVLGLLTAAELKDGSPYGESLVVGGGLTIATAVGFAVPIIGTFSPTYTERMAKVWANDPAREKERLDERVQAPSFTMRALVGNGTVGLGGTF